MYSKVIFSFCIEYLYFLATICACHPSTIAYLPTLLCIERCLRKYYLIEFLFLLFHFAVTKNFSFSILKVITNKDGFTFVYFSPIASFDSSSVARSVFLFFHFSCKSFMIYCHSIFPQNEFGKIKRETKSIVELKCGCSFQGEVIIFFVLLHLSVKQTNTCFECTQERLFLFFYYFLNQCFLCNQFGIRLAHHLYQYR